MFNHNWCPICERNTKIFFTDLFLCVLIFLSLSVITGKVTSLTPGPRGSVTVEVSLIKAYKTGRLNIAKSGPAMSVTLTSTCKRCPGLAKGTIQLSVFTAFVCLCILHKHIQHLYRLKCVHSIDCQVLKVVI